MKLVNGAKGRVTAPPGLVTARCRPGNDLVPLVN